MGNLLKQLILTARPWVYFLWTPALLYPGLLAFDAGRGVSAVLYGLCFAGIFSAMLVQHFLHVAFGSSSTKSFDGADDALIGLAVVSAVPLIVITAYFTALRGLVIMTLFVIAGACLVGYAKPSIKSEWYWGIGQGTVSVGTYIVIADELTAGILAGSAGLAGLYYLMLHSTRLAEGDYANVTGREARGWRTVRYSFFFGVTLLMAGFVL